MFFLFTFNLCFILFPSLYSFVSTLLSPRLVFTVLAQITFFFVDLRSTKLFKVSVIKKKEKENITALFPLCVPPGKRFRQLGENL